MKLGDRLYLWEAGTTTPLYTPHTDSTYLTLLEQYRTLPRACPQVDCAEGFAWIWVAIRTGTTIIDLSPACRQSQPPCALPDFGVTVHITS
jgi:hypothetical protein